MREQVDAGLTQPAIVVDLMLDQVAAQSKPPLRVAAAGRVSTLPERDPGARQAAARAGAAAYQQQFVPSWKRLETYLRDSYRPRARPQTGAGVVARRPGRLRRLVRAYTTTWMSPEQIHQLGLRKWSASSARWSRCARRRLHRPVTEFERSWQAAGHDASRAQAEMLAYAGTCWRACSRRCRAVPARAGSRSASGRFPPIARRRRRRTTPRAPPTARARHGST